MGSSLLNLFNLRHSIALNPLSFGHSIALVLVEMRGSSASSWQVVESSATCTAELADTWDMSDRCLAHGHTDDGRYAYPWGNCTCSHVCHCSEGIACDQLRVPWDLDMRRVVIRWRWLWWTVPTVVVVDGHWSGCGWLAALAGGG
jgi:hypothetical protein